jgi:hypothetical protein
MQLDPDDYKYLDLIPNIHIWIRAIERIDKDTKVDDVESILSPRRTVPFSVCKYSVSTYTHCNALAIFILYHYSHAHFSGATAIRAAGNHARNS